MLGVDSLHNVSGAQGGDLDPAKNMFWSWTTGYIMLKLEGTAPSSTVSGNVIEYHLGGFKGINKTQRNFNLSFGTAMASVTKTTTPKIILKVNANEMFKTPTTLSFATLPIVSSAGANAKLIADNYADMIQFKQISN